MMPHRRNGKMTLDRKLFLDSLEPVHRDEGKELQTPLAPPIPPSPPPPCTLLWFVLCELLGPEDADKNGSFYWACPRCGEGLLHTLPHRPSQRDRWQCWKCSSRRDNFFFMGDAFDALKYLHPSREVREDYNVRSRVYEAMKAEYDLRYVNNQLRPAPARTPAATVQAVTPNSQATASTSPRGSGVGVGGARHRFVHVGSGTIGTTLKLSEAEFQAVLLASELCDVVNFPFDAIAIACHNQERTDHATPNE